MDVEILKSPTRFLKLMLEDLPEEAASSEYETWWEEDVWRLFLCYGENINKSAS
jgi:hypothetical protein